MAPSHLTQHGQDGTDVDAYTKQACNVSKIPVCCRSVTLGGAPVAASDAVRVLGVMLMPDLSLDKHVTAVSDKCFFQLRQLRRILRSLDDHSAAILVHALVATTVAVS